MPEANHDISDLGGEQWRPVPGFERWYEVSNLGRVKSLGTSRGHRPRILRQAVKHRGYPTVCLYRGDARQQRMAVYRLVLVAFIGECPEGHEACHRDGDTSNNTLSNLCWGTAFSHLEHLGQRHTWELFEAHFPAKDDYHGPELFVGRWPD